MSRSNRSSEGSSRAGAPGSGADAAADSTSAPVEAPTSPLRWLWDQVGTLVLAVAIALTIRAFVVEPYRIPSGSMLPTLLIGDHLFVNKFVYGPRIPFTDWRLPGFRMPERGDVVVFEVARGDGRRTEDIVPADLHPDLPRDDFVKRIVGLPGDRISVSQGGVTINGVPVEQVALGTHHRDELGRLLDVHREVLGQCVHAVLDDPDVPGLQVADLVVPEGRYFMMGDNRDYSNDSRRWGTVRLEEIKGPAFILYWSWSVNGNALEFFNPFNWWNAEKRWDRVFSRVRCDSAEDLPAP
jgi:signal peptidase I